MKDESKQRETISQHKPEGVSSSFMNVMRDIKEFMVSKKVGNIQVNMFKGGITNWTINETKK